MKRLSRSRHHCLGFTILELVLAMAIMLIVVPFAFGTFYIISVSHAEVALVNDAKDFATLNANALENILINSDGIIVSNSTSPETGYAVISFNTDSELLVDGATVFDYTPYKLKDGTLKWDLDVSFELDAVNKIVKYTILVRDNAKLSHPIMYSLRGSVYVLSANPSLLAGTTGDIVKFSRPVL